MSASRERPADTVAITLGLYTPTEQAAAAARTAAVALLYSDEIAHFSGTLAPAVLEAPVRDDGTLDTSLTDFARAAGVDLTRLRTAWYEAASDKTPYGELYKRGQVSGDVVDFLLLAQLDSEQTGINIVLGIGEALTALSVLPALRQDGITPILDRMTFRFAQWVDEQARISSRWPTFRGLRERLDVTQGILAHELLGSLPAFPDAAIDVVFDVRDRLQGPRTRFRAAVAETAEDLADVRDADLHGAIAELRRTKIEPGIQEIRETLDELRAAPSLLRVISDRATVASATASLALIAGAAAGGIDAGAAVQAVAAASSLSGGVALELRARRELRRTAARQPWYLLHELNDGAV